MSAYPYRDRYTYMFMLVSRQEENRFKIIESKPYF